MKDQKLLDLLKEMTIAEKIGQCSQLDGSFFGGTSEITGPLENLKITEDEVYQAGSVIGIESASEIIRIQKEYISRSRLNIPLLFMADVVHGCYTIFPTPLALSSSFNPSLANRSSQIAAKEASIQGHHVTFAPMCDLARDARWGRNMETAGESPLVGKRFAEEYVKGFQGKTLEDEYTIASCAKHFAGYGLVQAGREYNTVDVSERFLRQFHFPAYKSAIDADAKMMMTAFNTIDSIPCTGNKWLMDDVLRVEMGFDGVLISDWGAVKELINNQVAGNEKDAAKKSLEATCDIEMMTPCYYHELEELVNGNEELLQLLDKSTYRILKLKKELGLFENPYRFANPEEEMKIINSGEHIEIAREVANECPVLLKNDNVLPLKNDEFDVLGPLANCNDLLGAWSWKGDREKIITISKSLNKDVSSLESCDHETVIYCAGEESIESGEAHSKVDINLNQTDVDAIKSLKESGKKVILVLISGRPMALSNVVEYCDAILVAWQLGTTSGLVIADILKGNVNPSGKLTMSFPAHTGQCPIFYNDFQTGRPLDKATDDYVSKYIDCQNEPLFSFGEGLNYSSINIEEVMIKDNTFTDELDLKIKLTNTGIIGQEVVQIYMRDLVADVITPLKELIYFEKVTVEKELDLDIKLSKELFAYYNNRNELKVDEGEFTLMVGLNSSKTKEFTIFKK